MSNDNVQQSPTSPVALSIDEAAEAILNNWRDADEPSQEGNLEATEDSSETNDDSVNEDTENDVSDDTNEDPEQQSQENELDNESETEDQDENSDESEEESEEEEEIEILADDAIVEVTVDGNVEQVSVKSLKRLHGQESSLTKKSQEVSQSRKEADEAIKQADFVMQSMLTRAEERYKPYSELASKTMEADDFALLRNEANQAQSDLKYLQEESQKLYTEAQDKMVAQQRENATKAIEVLKQDIPEWSTQLYDQIREFSITSGLPEQEVNQYSDPTVIKLLHKAMLYDKSKKTANVKKVKAKKTKVLRSKKAPPSPKQTKDVRKQAAYDKLRTQGGKDLDDISAAILAGWES